MKKIETKKTQHKCALVSAFLLILLLTGTLFLRYVEKVPFLEAFYYVCATMTTLGYGSPSFSSRGGRVFAVLWILVGTIFVAQFFMCFAELGLKRGRNNW